MTRLAPHLTVLHLAHGEILAETHQPISKVYFPHGGIISCVVELEDGGAIETGMIGKDGSFGAGQALDGRVSLNQVVMQVPGDATVMEATTLKALSDEMPVLRELVVKYDQFFVAQVQQVAACNAVHDVHHRTCKWLLRMHSLVGPDLPLTQEFLAQMMGVRRTSVTGVAQELQKLEIISYRRGHVHIRDLEMVRHHACECDAALRSHHRRLFPPQLPLSGETRNGRVMETPDSQALAARK
jgi:CRP-like cAMP-binding protein